MADQEIITTTNEAFQVHLANQRRRVFFFMKHGILMTIKDKNTPVSTKLKLARFAWAKPEVLIPNKYQQILDFVCGLLVNKKKNNLEKGKEILVWQSLLDFLTVSQSAITVKPSIQQAVIENILTHVKQKSVAAKQDRKHLANVIDCGLLLLSIPSVHSSLFSGLCHLLSATCHVCVLDSLDRVLLCKAQVLLQSTVTVLAKRQTTYHDQVQVVLCIVDMLPVILKYQEKYGDDNLQHFILTSLFHKDHKDAHAVFLRCAFSNDDGEKASGNTPGKYITKLYTALCDQVSPYVAYKLLPAFVTEFMKQNRSDLALCFLLLKHTVTKMLKIVCTPSQTKPPDHLTPDIWISCLGGCLKACSITGCDVFATENRQEVTKWFCHLVELVLPHSSVPSWCDFMTATLDLSPLVIEKYLTDILKGALTKRENVNANTGIAQDTFLSVVVAIFLKLRRTLDFLSSLLSAVDSGVSCDGSLSCFVKFKDKLGVMFNEAPITSLMDMWEKIEDGLESALQVKKAKEKLDKLSWLLFLLDSLLSHTRLFDQRSMGVAEKKLHSLLELTENNVLVPLAKTKEEIPGLSDVLTTWTSVKVMLYPKWREHSSDGGIGKGDEDKTTRQLLKTISLSTKVCLSLQRQHIASTNIEEKGENVNDLMKDLMDFLSPTTENVFAVWTGNEEFVKAVHQPLLQFREFCGLFPLVGDRLSDDLVHKCAMFIIDVLSLTGENKHNTMSLPALDDNQLTLGNEVKQFLSHPSTRESQRLQTYLACLTWNRLLAPSEREVDSPMKKKVKKSKTGERDRKVPELLEFITDVTMVTADFSIFPEEIAKSLTVAGTASVALIELLMSLDLEYLPVISLKCQFGFLAMAACLKSGGFTHKDNLVPKIESALLRCLSGQNLAQFFSLVKPEKFVEFAFTLCSQPLTLSTRFLECCVQVVMNNRLAVLSIMPLVKQLVTNLRCDDIKPTEIQILAASRFIRNCRQYIAKSFHIEEIAGAALDIFCAFAKVTVKHALKWISHDQRPKARSVSEGKMTKKGKKRKLSDVEKQTVTAGKTGNVGDNENIWHATVECVTEVLLLWSHDIADERMNHQLSSVVRAIHGRMKEDLESFTERIPDQAKLVQLNFLKSVCLCNSRLSSPSSSLTTEPPSTSSFCLLEEKDITDIWENVFGLATSELSAFARNDFESEKLDVKGSNEGQHFTHNKQDRTSKLKGREFRVDEFGSWPRSLKACLDVLMCVLETEAVQEERVLTRLRALTQHLNPGAEPNLPCVLIVLSVWRRVVASSFLSDSLSDEVLNHLYQFVASSLNLLQDLDHQKVLVSLPESASSSPASSAVAAATAITTTKAESSSPQTLQRDLLSPTCHFILHTLSDLIDLSKAFNAPQITTLCLQAGPLISLVSPHDVQALQRLVNTFVVQHPSSAIKAASAVMSLVSNLVCACVQLGSQTRLSHQCPWEMDEVVKCAQLVSRVLVVLTAGDFKNELSKIAHCVLSDYVMEIQKGALHPKVKTELVRGLYLLMGICDKFRLSALNAALPAGVKETFKFMHQDFDKYYRYQGTV